MLLVLRRSVVSLLLMVVITGVVYPLVMTAIGHVVFPHRSHGSLIVRGDKIVGSELIGQPFDESEVLLAQALRHQSAFPTTRAPPAAPIWVRPIPR